MSSSATAAAAFASLVDASAALDPALFAPAVAAANHYLAEHTQFQLHSLATEQRHTATWRLEQQANANAEVRVCASAPLPLGFSPLTKLAAIFILRNPRASRLPCNSAL